MGGPVFNREYFVQKAKTIEGMGAHSLCLKDMAGLLAPYDAYDLISALKDAVSIPVQLHSHYTSGMAQMTQLKAIEAGVDVVDTALSPLALRSSHPPIEPLVVTLGQTDRDPGFALEELIEAGRALEGVLQKGYRHLHSGDAFSLVDTAVLTHQVPGRHDDQPVVAAAGSRCYRPAGRGPGRAPPDAGRPRLAAARHAHQPDRRHPGRAERPVRPLQHGDRAGEGLRVRPVRPPAAADGPRGRFDRPAGLRTRRDAHDGAARGHPGTRAGEGALGHRGPRQGRGRRAHLRALSRNRSAVPEMEARSGGAAAGGAGRTAAASPGRDDGRCSAGDTAQPPRADLQHPRLGRDLPGRRRPDGRRP